MTSSVHLSNIHFPWNSTHWINVPHFQEIHHTFKKYYIVPISNNSTLVNFIYFTILDKFTRLYKSLSLWKLLCLDKFSTLFKNSLSLKLSTPNKFKKFTTRLRNSPPVEEIHYIWKLFILESILTLENHLSIYWPKIPTFRYGNIRNRQHWL